MLPDTPSRRAAAIAALVTAPVLSLVSVALQPPFQDDSAAELAAFADGWAPVVSAACFVAAQLAILVAVLAVGRLLIPRAPRLSAWGTALGVFGCFGHAVFGGIALTYLVMARDEARREEYAALMDAILESPVMIVAMLGLAGFVLGLLLLGIGLFRARVGARWIGPAIWAFLLLEFVGSNLSDYASYLAVLLFGAAFLAVAVELRSASDVDHRTVPVPLDDLGRRA